MRTGERVRGVRLRRLYGVAVLPYRKRTHNRSNERSNSQLA